MKNLIVIILLFMISNNFLISQNIISKVNNTKIATLNVVYDITYPAKTPILNSIYFKECMMYMHGVNILYKYMTQDNTIQTSLSNDCNETTYNSFQYKEQMLMKVTKDGLRSAFKLPPPEIRMTDETKIILGLKCKKIVAESKGAGNNVFINSYYIFDKMDSNYCSTTSIAGLTGWMFGCEPINYSNSILLGAEIDLGKEGIQVWTAKSMNYVNVDSSFFDIPQNMSIMTYEEYNEKILTDKDFRKEIKKEIRKDKTAEFNKLVWESLKKDLIESAVQVTQQTNAYQNYINNPNSQTLNNYMNVVINNATKDGIDAMKENNVILNNSYNNATVESSASTNGGNSNNSQQTAICAKKAKTEWEKSKEYINYMNNQSCNKMAYIAQRKQAEILRDSCAYCSSEADKEVLYKTISSLTQQINSMPDCSNFKFADPGKPIKTNITIVPSTTPQNNNNNGNGAVKAQ